MARTIRIRQVGGPEVLQFEELDVGKPGPDELCIRVEAIGLNRAEAIFRAGRYIEPTNLPARLGYEASGVVERVGSDVGGVLPGDAICVIPAFSMNQYGVYAHKAIVPASAVIKRPEGLGAVEAAAVWMAYLTAYGALIDIGKLGKGDAVVIQAASSSVGLAAIQIANSVGAVPIATTRTSTKRSALLDAGAAHVIASLEQDLATEVMRITNGKGARIVFDPVGGPHVEILAQAMSRGGTFFVYGNLSGQPTPFPRWMLKHGQSMRGYLLFEITKDQSRLERACAFISDGLRSGQFKPFIAKTFSFDQMVEAHRYQALNQHIGKIIVTVP
ncbi:NADPH:quinone reductase [Burkholderia multivorans]|jgi:NADPH:quinone reductase-like Zn-dependent oxidoreductase|uniref:zinc-dependent alcohol dehydrogenase family protein n=1 Tax=Burkholderia multivorans TaxID=87883 RepID=UPI0004AB40C8|nr:zinc-dependent alcohol dehydrogenase family protein [Burkholderia multivorans]KFX63969.1 NADPH:quinone reductase [Burkholderia sp. K24]PRF75139.1 NADPH:quinone reductase [Burkholderia multivorans]